MEDTIDAEMTGALMLYIIKDKEGTVYGGRTCFIEESTKWLSFLSIPFQNEDGSLYLLQFNCTRLSEKGFICP